jgi:uncharacterized membrane protein YfcA
MIVPSLVLLAGIEIKDVVGSSLAIIMLNAAAGLAGQIQKISMCGRELPHCAFSDFVIPMLDGLPKG